MIGRYLYPSVRAGIYNAYTRARTQTIHYVTYNIITISYETQSTLSGRRKYTYTIQRSRTRWQIVCGHGRRFYNITRYRCTIIIIIII